MRFLSSALFAIAIALCSRLPANASCTYPNTPSNGQIVDANALNANLTAISLCIVNLQPSTIVPTSTTNATFGGTLPYAFPAGLNVTGAFATTGTITSGGALSVTGAISASGAINAGGNVGGNAGNFSGAITASGLNSTANLYVSTSAQIVGSTTINGPLTITGLTPNQCVQTSAGGLLSTSGSTCFTSNVTKYTVTGSTSGSCAVNAICYSGNMTAISGNPTTTGNCFAMQNTGSNYSFLPIVSFNTPNYYLVLTNPNASAIPSGSAFTMLVTCQ